MLSQCELTVSCRLVKAYPVFVMSPVRIMWTLLLDKFVCSVNTHNIVASVPFLIGR